MSEEERELPADVLETLEALDWYAERSMVSAQIRHHLRKLREQLGRHYGELEFYTCEECNEEKPWSNGSDSSPECDDCWVKKEENTHG